MVKMTSPDSPKGSSHGPLAASSGGRLLYIDNLRILLITLVVLWHTAVTYGASGTWPYHEGQADVATTIIFTLFYAANGPYVLGFFFLISGYFATASFDRKGGGKFIWDWIRRLGIPLALYILIFDPLIVFGVHTVIEGYTGSFWQYLAQHFEGYKTLGVGPMWFIEGLLIILLLYGMIRLLFQSRKPSTSTFCPGCSNSIRVNRDSIISLIRFILGS